MWYDAGASWIGGYAPETNASFGHELAILDCQESAVHTAGPEVQVRWALWFDARFSGDKKTGLKCKDANKAKAKGQWKGTWTIE